MGWKPKMADMAQSPEEAKEDCIQCPEDPRYPYGLAISLTEKELDKLGLKPDCEVGDMLHLFAMSRVTSVSCHENQGGQSCRVELQIIALSVEDEDGENESDDEEAEPGESKAKRLYASTE
jgi:hypothetical protein